MLGAANWIIGVERTQIYSRMIVAHQQPAAATDYRSFDELDEGAAVLEPLTAEQRQASYATARMDFYHATFLTGYVLVLAGLLLTFLGFVALIRNDARQATARITDRFSQSTNNHGRVRMARDSPLE